jgi:hypothetical protein
MRRWWAGGLLLAVTGLAACSQTAALAPVGGNRLAEVRFAINDVLVAQHVSILTAPVCTASGAGDVNINCMGTTVDNRTIMGSSTSSDQDDIKVVIGTTTIFQGPFLAVLNSNAAPPS